MPTMGKLVFLFSSPFESRDTLALLPLPSLAPLLSFFMIAFHEKASDNNN
jgi:hypothetical protein